MLWHNRTDTPRTGAEFEAEILGGNPVVVEGSTNAAVTAAIAELDGGGVVRMPPGEYTFTGTVNVPQGVHILAYGAVIDHTANGVAFSLRHADAFSTEWRGSVRGFVLGGNSGASAVGVDIGNSWGAAVIDATIIDYTAGRAVRQFNETNWSEGTFLSNLMLRNNAIGVEFFRDGGTDSFAYQRWQHVDISVPEDGVGIDFGGTGGDPIYVYNCDFDVTCWLEGDNATAVLVRANANCDNNRYRITGEGIGSHTGRVGVDNIGGSLRGTGVVAIDGIANSLDPGCTTSVFSIRTPLDTTGGVDGTTVYQRLATTNPDVGHNAQFGFITDSGVETAFAGGFGGGPLVFQVLAVDFGDDPSLADVPFAVAPGGGGVYLHNGVNITSGVGSPEGVVTAPVGSLYTNTSGGASTTLYVKTSGAGNTGWAAK